MELGALIPELSPREQVGFTAIALVAVAIIVGAIRSEGLRAPLLALIRTVLWSSMTIWLALLAVYAVAITIAAAQVGMWEPQLLKDSMIWFLAVCLVAFFRIPDFGYENRQVRRLLKGVVGFEVVVVALTNLGTFPIVVEAILWLVLVPTGLALAFAEDDPDQRLVATFLGKVMVGGGLLIGARSLWVVATTWRVMPWSDIGLAFALPLWMSVALVPAILALSTWLAYSDLRMWARRERGGRTPVLVLLGAVAGLGLRPKRVWRVPGMTQHGLGLQTSLREGFAWGRRANAEAAAEPARSVPRVEDLDEHDDEEDMELTALQYWLLTDIDSGMVARAIKAAQGGEREDVVVALDRLAQHLRVRQARYIAAGGVQSGATEKLRSIIADARAATLQRSAIGLADAARRQRGIWQLLHAEFEFADAA